MDDNQLPEKNPTSPPPSSGGVMDIQPPKTTANPPGAPTLQGPVIEPEPERPLEPPAPDMPTPPSGGIIAPPEDNPEKPEEDHPAVQDAHHLLTAHANQAKKHHPAVPIIIAIIIALALAGLAVFAYVKTKDGTKPAGDHDTTQHQEDGSGASTGDVSDTDKAVDEAADAANKAEDFPESDLSDQALGL